MAYQSAPISVIRSDSLESDDRFGELVDDMSRDYYVSADCSPEFYLLQASRGLIAVATTLHGGFEVLLPQLQFSYCILPLEGAEPQRWRSVTNRCMHKGYTVQVNRDFEGTLRCIEEYHGSRSWITPQYRTLVRELYESGHTIHDRFRMCSIEVYDGEEVLVAGEIGYVFGSVFTSLTGFCKRMRNVSVGKLQIVSLARLLRSSGFAYLNLGQPPSEGSMEYKRDLGGVEVPRQRFLSLWDEHTQHFPTHIATFLRSDCSIDELV
jgi:Leu/Phe-tRNA-protein transferase